MSLRGWLRFREGCWETASASYDRALGIFSDLQADKLLAQTHLRLGNIAFERSRTEDAAAHFGLARNIAVEAHVPVQELRTLLEAVQPQQPPQVNVSLQRAAQQDDDRQRAKMEAELNHMALARAEIERTNRIAQGAVARISQPVSPIQETVSYTHLTLPTNREV